MAKDKKFFLLGAFLFFSLFYRTEIQAQSCNCTCIPVFGPVQTCQGTPRCSGCPENFEAQPQGLCDPYTCNPPDCTCVSSSVSNWCAAAQRDPVFGWLECTFWYIFSLPIRVVFFIVPAVGLLLAIVAAIFCMVIQQVAVSLLSLGMQSSGFQIFSEASTIAEFIGKVFLKISLYIIALATIFRVREYEAQRFLLPLLVAGILMHFATGIAEFIITTGNNFTQTVLSIPITIRVGRTNTTVELVSALGSFVTVESIWEDVIAPLGSNLGEVFMMDGEFLKALLVPYNKGGTVVGPYIIDLGAIAVTSWLSTAFYFVAGVLIFIFGFMFILRTVYLWILLAIAPLGIATLAIGTPIVQKIFPGPLHWSRWFPMIIEWSLMGIVLAFWLYVAFALRESLATLDTSSTSQGEIKPLAFLSDFLPPDKKTPLIIKNRVLLECTWRDAGPGCPASELVSTTLVSVASTTFQTVMKLFRYLVPLVALYVGVKNSPSVVSGIVNSAFGLVTGVVQTAAMATGVGAAAGVIGRLSTGLKAGAGAFKEAWAERGEGVKGAAKALGRGMGGFLKEAGSGYAKGLGAGIQMGAAAGLTKAVQPIPQQIRTAVGRPMWATRALEGEEKVMAEVQKEVSAGYEKGGEAYLARVMRTGSKEMKMAAVATAVKERKVSALLADDRTRESTLRFLNSKAGATYAGSVVKLRPDLAPQIINPKTGSAFDTLAVMDGMTGAEFDAIETSAYQNLTSENLDLFLATLSDPAKMRRLRKGPPSRRQQFAEAMRSHSVPNFYLRISQLPPERKKYVIKQLHDMVNDPMWST